MDLDATTLLGSEWVVATAILVLSVVAALAVRVGLPRALDHGEPGRVLGRQLGRILSVVVVVVGLVWALGEVGVAVAPALGALGLTGVAVAFAAQDILQNFIAGIIIQIRRPFRVGDQVTLMEYDGTVRDVDMRAVRLHTFDGLDVVLPAREVLATAIVNHTRTPTRRTTLEIGVRYDTDLEHARAVVLRAATAVDGVLAEPATAVWVREFADSAIVLELMYWHASDIATLRRVRSDVAVAVKRALDAADVEIPFPQRVLHWGDGSAPGPRP
ncbi:mechanosensitive ion channel family protein [Phycicoccus flavus]|uniref:mechanosensitive ion channel family protein n=1 Tax=Phycicoccus flavus TaxID=2502783 RepID=UPI000FEC0B3E|nr:mechanosensitive ion channel family protein [Phycicoccus flavus]NHA69309.1 mechanosensitive ion channel family protein [Phycicoccus flavus]